VAAHSFPVRSFADGGVGIARPDSPVWIGAFGGYTGSKGSDVRAALRFIWNATRGHRLAPWRSEYFKWRIETYSGRRAETLKAGDVLSFVWANRWDLLGFLAWTNQIDRESRRREKSS